VVFCDQLGCGRSEIPQDAALWSIPRFVEELELLRTALRLPEMHLFGHSWGAIVALEYSLRFPKRVSSIIFLSPSLSIELWRRDARKNIEAMPEEHRRSIEEVNRSGAYDRKDYRRAVAEYYSRHVCRLDPKPEPMILSEVRAGEEVYKTMWGPDEFTPTGTLADYDGRDKLMELSIPVLFCCGEFDEVSEETLEEYKRLTPGAEEICIFSNSSHHPQFENPGEFFGVITDYLNRLGLHQNRRKRFRFLVSILLLLSIVLLIFCSCSEPKVAGGELTIRNDILDKSYNSFVVDQLVTKRGPTSFTKVFRPGDEVTLPYKGIRSMRFTRPYEDHDKIYLISCPEDFNTRTLIKLIDVHTNRMGGGCELNKRGQREHGRYVKWE
jgi:proline iminopeptidase